MLRHFFRTNNSKLRRETKKFEDIQIYQLVYLTRSTVTCKLLRRVFAPISMFTPDWRWPSCLTAMSC